MRSLGALLCAVAVALFLCRVEESTSQEQPTELQAEMPGQAIAVDGQMLSTVESTDCTQSSYGDTFNDLALEAVGIHVQEHASDNEAWPEHAAGSLEADADGRELGSGRFSGASA